MQARAFQAFLAALICLFLVGSVTAHVPIVPGQGTSLGSAVEIDNPTKSWVIYSELHSAEEPLYFHFEIDAGTRIRLTLMSPASHALSGFLPSLGLMGPGLVDEGIQPSFLETPSSGGVMILTSDTPKPEYEGFTPTSFYELLDIDLIAPDTGVYYIAVYDATTGGPFAMALGYIESFTLDEWLLVPFSVMIIHRWTGQSLAMMLAPALITLVLGILLVAMSRRGLWNRKSMASWVAIAASMLFVGSGVTVFYQMILSLLEVPANYQVAITVIFGLIPVLLGLAALRISLRTGWTVARTQRAKMFVLGAVGPFAWAGLLVGPALLMFASVVPSFTATLRGAAPMVEPTSDSH